MSRPSDRWDRKEKEGEEEEFIALTGEDGCPVCGLRLDRLDVEGCQLCSWIKMALRERLEEEQRKVKALGSRGFIAYHWQDEVKEELVHWGFVNVINRGQTARELRYATEQAKLMNEEAIRETKKRLEDR